MMGPDEALKAHGYPWTVGEEQMTAEMFEDETVWPIIDGKGRMLGEVDSQEIAQFIVDAVNISLESVEEPREEFPRTPGKDYSTHPDGLYVFTAASPRPFEEIRDRLKGDERILGFNLDTKPDENGFLWFQGTVLDPSLRHYSQVCDVVDAIVGEDTSYDDYDISAGDLAQARAHPPMEEFSDHQGIILEGEQRWLVFVRGIQ